MSVTHTHYRTSQLSERMVSHLSGVLSKELSGVLTVAGGTRVSGLWSIPLLGEETLWLRLASYSKVRFGLGRGLTGAPGGPGGPGEPREQGRSGLSDIKEATLNLCLNFKSFSEPGYGASGSVATEQMLLRLLSHVLSKSSWRDEMVKVFCRCFSKP